MSVHTPKKVDFTCETIVTKLWCSDLATITEQLRLKYDYCCVIPHMPLICASHVKPPLNFSIKKLMLRHSRNTHLKNILDPLLCWTCSYKWKPSKSWSSAVLHSITNPEALRTPKLVIYLSGFLLAIKISNSNLYISDYFLLICFLLNHWVQTIGATTKKHASNLLYFHCELLEYTVSIS